MFQRQLPPSKRESDLLFLLAQGHLWGCSLGPTPPSQVCNLSEGETAECLVFHRLFITHSPEFRSATIACHLKVGQLVLHLPPVGSRMRASPILSAKEEELESTPRLGSSSGKLAAEETLQSPSVRWPHTHTYLKAVPGVLVPFGELSPPRLRIIKHWVLGLP